MNEEKKSIRKSPSMFQKVKKTLRQKSRDSNKPKKAGSKASDRSKSDIPSKFLRGRKGKKSDRTKSNRNPTGKKVIPRECNTSRSTSRESDQKSRLEHFVRSIDLEEDGDPILGTPDLLRRKKKKGKRGKERREKDKKELSKEGPGEEKAGTPRSKQKAKSWLGMEAAVSFFNKNNDIQKIRNEYHFLDSLTCSKTTESFDANTARNREGSPKIYDENRVKLNRPGHEDVNYINASFIKMKSFGHKIIVAQLPQLENESFVEDFWHMIYQEQITLVYLLVPEKALKNTSITLFKEEHGAYQYTGKMFINNRRAEVLGDPKEYTIEVLPEGNSDSVMCQVNHHATWEHLQQPPKYRPIIKMIHQFLSEKQVQNANICVVSVFGCGRACSFIGALYAISQLNQGIEPNICDIMRDIQQQRPKATESFAQYSGVYAIVLDYIVRKRGSKRDPINREINRFIDELTDISPAVSPINEKNQY
uniref:Tyrosine-protein phosphatase domain-containing protein n=1 Tax=Caenorhabditis tropicalis TaxID=1561998 RepID=A0A1I7UA52_9PELO